MSDTFAIAEAAIRNSMATLDRVSNNVANANTPAYKRELAVQSAFDGQLRGQELSQRVIAKDWSPGAIEHTGGTLDFVIEGDAWFQLQAPQGVVLTRNGSFRTDAGSRLVSSQGWPVLLDTETAVPPGALALRANNELWVDGVRVGQFALVNPPHESLQVAGPGLYRAPAGALDEPTQATVRQGYVEASNVNSLHEMVDLMQAVRQAEAAQRIMRAYDESIETALTTLGEF